ncbi:MAG: hypothetical protein JWO20_1286, partial [Candidatus Angelobacter sp.]|nr:hypothetical protein [Candidatus Angelobacter sp.]
KDEVLCCIARTLRMVNKSLNPDILEMTR